MMPSEFWAVVELSAQELRLAAAADEGDSVTLCCEPQKILDLEGEAKRLIKRPDPKAGPEPTDRAKRRLRLHVGAVYFDPPVIQVGNLAKGRIAARTGWYDRDTGQDVRDEDAVKLFSLIKRRLKFDAAAKVQAAAVGEPETARAYPYIKCSKGAAHFFATGGRLADRGGSNVEYSISRSDSANNSP